MRVLALGGYGTFGRIVAKNLCASDLVTEFVVAGRNLDAARKFADELCSLVSKCDSPFLPLWSFLARPAVVEVRDGKDLVHKYRLRKLSKVWFGEGEKE